MHVSAELARPVQINTGPAKRRGRKEFRQRSFADCGLSQPLVFVSGYHDNGFPAMLCHALWTALASKPKHLTEAGFGVLKLPFLLQDLDFRTLWNATPGFSACVANNLTTLVRSSIFEPVGKRLAGLETCPTSGVDYLLNGFAPDIFDDWPAVAVHDIAAALVAQ